MKEIPGVESKGRGKAGGGGLTTGCCLATSRPAMGGPVNRPFIPELRRSGEGALEGCLR